MDSDKRPHPDQVPRPPQGQEGYPGYGQPGAGGSGYGQPGGSAGYGQPGDGSAYGPGGRSPFPPSEPPDRTRVLMEMREADARAARKINVLAFLFFLAAAAFFTVGAASWVAAYGNLLNQIGMGGEVTGKIPDRTWCLIVSAPLAFISAVLRITAWQRRVRKPEY